MALSGLHYAQGGGWVTVCFIFHSFYDGFTPQGWVDVEGLAGTRLTRVLSGSVFRRVSRTTSTLSIRYCMMNKCIHSLFLRHPSGSVSIIIIKDKVRITSTLGGGLNGGTRLSIFQGFKATRIGCGSARIRFIKTQGRDCGHSSHGPVMRSKALRSSRGHHSFAVGTVTIYLGGSHFNRLISPFRNICSLRSNVVTAPLSPSVAFSSSPLHVVEYMHFTARLGFRVRSRACTTLSHGTRQLGVVDNRHVYSRVGGVVLSGRPDDNFCCLGSAKLLSLVLPRLITVSGIRAHGKGTRGGGCSRAVRILRGIYGRDSGL